MASNSSYQLTGREVLGIDAGTQGISVVLYCPERYRILARAEHSYPQGCNDANAVGHIEHRASYWSDALSGAMQQLREQVAQDAAGTASKGRIETVAAIGVTGHMHCLVAKDAKGRKPFPCDMWNDPRGEEESAALSLLFDEHIPARWTASHILCRAKTNPQLWRQSAGVTVTSGSLVHDLSGEWVLGAGDASGMFGALDCHGQIDREKLSKMDALIQSIEHLASPAACSVTPLVSLADLVPKVVPCSEVAAYLSAAGSELLGGLPVGIPIAAPEGDQQAVLVVSAVDEGEMALSAGTSFTGNMMAKESLKARDESSNVLCSAEQHSMLMVCVRNGTLGFSHYVRGLAQWRDCSFTEAADALTDLAEATAVTAEGCLLHGLFQGENVTELPLAKGAMEGIDLALFTDPGLMARLLLESPCFILRYGLEQRVAEIGPLKKVVLTGGVLQSKAGFAPQMYSDILGVPIEAMPDNDEGSAKGAAVLASYMIYRQQEQPQPAHHSLSLAEFSRKHALLEGREESAGLQCWQPNKQRHLIYQQRYLRFKAYVEQQQKIAAS